MALRWGIAGAGKISSDFAYAVETLPRSDHQILAVGARFLANAEKFAKDHDIPNAYEGYLKLAEDKDIDIVYIGNLNPQHFEVSKQMLEHGKHVLVETPFTMNEKQTRALIDIARTKKLFLMEGVWSRCFPVYIKLKKLLHSGVVGDVVQVNATFGFPLQGVDRLSSKELGGGTILDMGVYVLQLPQLVFRGETPINVLATGGLNSEGVDECTSSIWTYSGDRIACLTTSAKAFYPNEAVIIGTKGIIKIPEFWCPTKLITPDLTYGYLLPESNAVFNFHNGAGLSYEAECVRVSINDGQIESPHLTHNESIQLAQQVDSLRRSVGVVFPEDEQ